jgi:hypothetical protein
MEKIIKLALGLSYPKDKLNALQEIIHATPNPQMATEILLGVYEKPRIPSKVKTKEGQVRVLKEVNFWTETVVYSYLQNKRIGGYYPKGTDSKTLNDNNYKALQCKDDDAVYLYFNSEEKEEKQSTCSIQDWLSYEDITPQHQFENIYNV